MPCSGMGCGVYRTKARTYLFNMEYGVWQLSDRAVVHSAFSANRRPPSVVRPAVRFWWMGQFSGYWRNGQAAPRCLPPRASTIHQRFPIWECRTDCWITRCIVALYLGFMRGSFFVLVCHWDLLQHIARTHSQERGSAADVGDHSMPSSDLAF